jgi:hypothetical protein
MKSCEDSRSLMKKAELFAVPVAIAFLLVIAAVPARAQMSDTPPVVVKQTPAKKVWLNAIVIHSDNNSIMVHDAKNSLILYTFTYANSLRDKMQKILDSGGYQSGDKVRILYEQGTTLAIDVRGRPSKPI